MPTRSSGGGCGGFLLGWCIFFGISTLLAGWGSWKLLGTLIPELGAIVLILAVGIAVVEWLAK